MFDYIPVPFSSGDSKAVFVFDQVREVILLQDD